MEENIRSEMLLGNENLEILKKSTVAIFGLGGVGSFACEAIARIGVGRIILVDSDKVELSNINRQLLALHSTVGQYKTTVMRQRIFDISPETLVIEKPFFYAPDNREEFFEEKIDYIIDAIDSLDSKIDLIKTAKEKNISIISAMGTGNKFHPEKFMISDLSKTKVCPLARRLRRALKEEGITHLKVVYSEEEPKKVLFSPNKEGERTPPGSLSFVPPVAGFLLASAVIRDLINKEF